MNFYPWSCPLELQSRERSFRLAYLLHLDFFLKCHPVAETSHTSALAGRHWVRVPRTVSTRRGEEEAWFWAPGSIGELLEWPD